jgi:hypothetical protein
MPRSMAIRMPLIQTIVAAALRLFGSLKAVMPFEIASTPVSAVQPLENARRIRKSASGPTLAAILSTLPIVWCGAAAVSKGRPSTRCINAAS